MREYDGASRPFLLHLLHPLYPLPDTLSAAMYRR